MQTNGSVYQKKAKVSYNSHRDKDDLGAKPLDEFIAEITNEIESRSL